MKNKDFTGIVPEQYTGKEIEADASVDLGNDNDAKAFYLEAKQRLLYVNNWHKTAGIISAHFQLVSANGQEIDRNAAKGDFIRVDIPGPGSKEGDGYDWVYIEDLKEMKEDHVESIGFRVRPTKNPDGNKNEIAHFYSDESTSNFIITREGTKLTATIIDRNAKPNSEAESITDKIRHSTIGMTAINSFSKIQWQNLANGLVK